MVCFQKYTPIKQIMKVVIYMLPVRVRLGHNHHFSSTVPMRTSCMSAYSCRVAVLTPLFGLRQPFLVRLLPDFTTTCRMVKLPFRIRCVPLPSLDLRGGYVFCCNYCLGGIDPSETHEVIIRVPIDNLIALANASFFPGRFEKDRAKMLSELFASLGR